MALSRYPQLNSRIDTERGEIIRWSAVNLSFAVHARDRIVVPVVHDAHRMTASQLAVEVARVTAMARDGRLSRAELSGGTFTLNNYGVFGVDGATPILNYPESAMLGVGRITDKPWVTNGRLSVRKVVQLSLTFDHRICDGADAAGFLRYVADLVEQPSAAIQDFDLS